MTIGSTVSAMPMKMIASEIRKSRSDQHDDPG